MRRELTEPGDVQRSRIGDPEQLLVDGGAQFARAFEQLLLVELQFDSRTEQAAIGLLQLVHQLATRVVEPLQGVEQRRTHLDPGFLQALAGQALALTQGIALAHQVELTQPQIGDLVLQGAPCVYLGQRAALFTQDARQQQAAADRLDLLVEATLQLAHVIELAARGQALAHQPVVAVIGPQQLQAELAVDLLGALEHRMASLQHRVAARGIGNRLLGGNAPLAVDHALQQHQFGFLAGDLLDQQVAALLAELAQPRVAA